MKRTLNLYKTLQKYLVDPLTLSSVTANDTWHKTVEYLCVTAQYYCTAYQQLRITVQITWICMLVL